MFRPRLISGAVLIIWLICLKVFPFQVNGQTDQVDELIKKVRIGGVSMTDRLTAIRSLGEFKDKRAVHALLGQLLSGEKAVREEAARALGNIGPLAAREVIFASRLYANNDNRKRTAEALSEIKDPAVEQELKTRLKQNDLPIVAGAYKYYVAHIPPGDKKAEDTLVKALNRYGDQYVAEAYIKSGNHRLEAAGRQWLAHQAELSSAKDAQELFSTSAKARKAGLDFTAEAAKALVGLGPKAIESAAQMLADKNQETLVRQEAGICLTEALEEYRKITVSDQVKEGLQKAAADDNLIIAGRAKRALWALKVRGGSGTTSQ